MTDHTALISSLEKATEGSAELDAQIFRASGAPLPEQFAGLKVDLQWQPDGSATMPVGDMQVRYTPPAYTTSLDAIVALIERKFPGHLPGFIALASDRSHTASTFALGLCARLLRAIQHQGGGNG